MAQLGELRQINVGFNPNLGGTLKVPAATGPLSEVIVTGSHVKAVWRNSTLAINN
jgi:hypothetical protein